MAYLLSYTREPINSFLYDPKLAYSMHLAISEDGKEYQALNHNSGVLFVKAAENEDGSLNPKSLKNPWLFHLPERQFGVAAIRTSGDGEEDEESKGCVVIFRSRDLLEYDEIGLLQLGSEYIEEIRCRYEAESGHLKLVWRERTGNCYTAWIPGVEELRIQGEVAAYDRSACTDMRNEQAATGIDENISLESIEGAVPHNVIEISEQTADRLRRKLLTPYNTGICFPEQIKAAGPADLEKYRAEAVYSDGTREWKRVDWDLSQVDFTKKGTYEITGTVHQDHFAFPIAYNRADPCIGRWNGKYYFIATNDADNNHTLYVREADTIPELAEAEEHLILDSSTYPGIGGLLWAPEFHEIDGKLYIFHAATPGEFFSEESHVMELREGGNPACREDWSAPRRVVKNDGSDICEAGKEITLDMTCFEWQGEWFAVWSQRQFLPKDLGAWLYIAKLNPREPWRLLSEPVILSKPEYGWANNHTFVDEGPFALIAENTLYLTFSSAAVDSSYVVGLLSIEKGNDLLQVHNWKKKNYPILTSRSVEGEFGTGHNAYVVDEDGTVWNTYHARPGVEGVRSSGIRRVHFDIDGEPVLDMTEELDLKEEYRTVRTKLTVVNQTIIHNPMIWADLPDIDVIRAGDTFYMVSTSMHSMPGCPIMKSKDLAHWELAHYVFDSFEDNPGHNLEDGKGIYGKGSWAASLRFHDGYYYLVFNCNDTHHFYIYRTEDIERGGWQQWAKLDQFFHDPALIFDDDGTPYVIYGCGDIRIVELKRDLSDVKEGGIHQYLLHTPREDIGLPCEGGHAYKINGMYYLIYIEWPKKGNGNGWRREVCYRSEKLLGPYERKVVLDDDMGYMGQGVAQGCIFDTPSGDWIAMLFQDHHAVGRIPYLLPVTWEDGWPMMGINGKVPESFTAALQTEIRPGEPLVTSDGFNHSENKLALQWQWNHNPDNSLWSFTERPGFLRLKTGRLVQKGIVQARNTLTQRTVGPSCRAVTRIELDGLLPGDCAGLTALQGQFGLIGIRKGSDSACDVVMCENGGDYFETVVESIAWPHSQIYLKISFDFEQSKDCADFFYSEDGEKWLKLGRTLHMRYTLDHFMGYRIGLYCYAVLNAGGYADFDFFEIKEGRDYEETGI